MKRLALLLCATWLTACAHVQPLGPHEGKSAKFNAFFQQLEADAKVQNLNVSLLRQAYAGAPAPLASVAAARSNQPEFTQTFSTYVGRALSPQRLATGHKLVAEHRAVLQRIQTQTGVPGGLLVALWGLESNFGTHAGTTPIIPALVSLAYQSNRPDYFRRELFNALRVAEKYNLNPRTWVGSWAGASGGPQFMPTNILKHARDGDGDGRINLWGADEAPDVLASAANLLVVKGWQAGQPWRMLAPTELKLSGIELNARGLSEPFTAAEWAKRGLVQTTYPAPAKLRYYRPQPGGPAWLVGPNFQTLLNWNNSSFFAWSALTLADSLQRGAR